MSSGDDLLERGGARDRIEQVVAGAIAGRGGLLLIEADPGQGKTALLRHLARDASRRLQVRSAQGSELEQSLAWGVARQLLAEGPAGLAAPLAAGHDPVAVCFALTEACSEMAEGSPLLLLVDDAHWADPLSVRWLAHLAARLSNMPVAAVVATRGRDPRRPAEITVLAGIDGVDLYKLAPLTLEGTSALVRRSMPEAGEDLCRACHEASGGNAFLIVELARELEAAAATGSVPDPASIAELAIDRIDRVVGRRLIGAGEEATVLARAAAVCGAHAPAADVAAVAGLTAEAAATAAEALRGAGLIEERSAHLVFAHPLLRAAVERSIPVGQRTRLHLSAARRLDEQGEGVERVASHLLLAEPGSDPWVRERVIAAAQATLAAGAPGQAVALYQRALAERTGRDPGLLVALGRAAMGIDPDAAEAPLREALATVDADQKVAVALDLAVVLQTLRRPEDIVATLGPLAAELAARGTDRGARIRVEAELLAQSFFHIESRARRSAQLKQAAAEIQGRNPEESLILVQLAVDASNHGTARETLDFVERAWDGGALLELVGSPVSPAVQWIPYLYMYVDEPEKTLAIADRWSGEARARGSAVMACFAETLRAECLRRMGLLVDSLGAAEVAWGIATELGRGFPGWWISLSAVAQELVATGEPGRALELLDAAGVLEGPPPEIMLLPCPRVVRAECLTAAGHKERGVEELLAAWQWLDDMNEPSPGAWHFPALLVDGLLLMDRREEAADIAARWLARTEAFGASTTIGMAQRSLALTRSGPEQIEGLAAAERTLSGCPSASEHARALVELGSALRRAARRTEAREPLRQGLDRASRCGAKLLAARAAEELSATGARPRRIALTGVDSLSPGERRVAQLAAKGLTNREIASTLFLSRKTVEHHLGSIYTKLGTNERSRLATLIDGA